MVFQPSSPLVHILCGKRVEKFVHNTMPLSENLDIGILPKIYAEYNSHIFQ
jgi:hypothetical protein